MVKEITKEELGGSYAIACDRAHRLIANFYESLFDRDGSPKENSGEVANNITALRQQLNLELDLIREAAYQYHESKHAQKQEGLFGDNW